MEDCTIKLHPAVPQMMANIAELEEARTQLQMVLEPALPIYDGQIIEAQDVRKRAAYYGTIVEAVCAGKDFSRVESIQDIADIYARFIIGRAFEGE